MTTGESNRPARVLAPLGLAALLVLTGCGGDDGGATAPTDEPTTGASEPATTDPASDPASDPTSDPATAPSAPPSEPAAAAPTVAPPAAPTGAVPDGWQVVDPAGAATFALPPEAEEQPVPDTGVPGLDIQLYAVPDGSLLALYQSFPDEVAGSVDPQVLLAQAAQGALGAATFAEGTQREEPFELDGLPGTGIGGLDEASGTWLSGRLLVVDDVLLGFVATGEDEAAADEALEQAWGSLTLP